MSTRTASRPRNTPWIEITPAGVRRSRRSRSQITEDTRANLRKVRFIIGSNLKLDAFETALGRAWIVLEPALQALMYYVLIRILLGVRGDAVSFAFIFTAISFWRSHATLVGTSPNLVPSRGLEVLQNNMSMQILYLEYLGTEFAAFLMRFSLLLPFLLFNGVNPHWTWPLALLVGSVQFLFSAALVVWLSIIGVFIRDLGKFFYIITTIWWYLSPGLYTLSTIPDNLLWLYRLNPFAHLFPAVHDTLLEGRVPAFTPLLLIALFSLAALVLGSRLVVRLRHRFFTLI